MKAVTTARAGFVAAVLLGTVLAGLGPAGPAAADPPGLVRVGATSASTSADKNMTVSCPSGTVVTGGGGYLTAPAASHLGLLSLDRLEPLNDGSGFVARMREVHPDGGNWALTAEAMCAPAPPGWDVVSFTQAPNTQIASVSCGSKRVIGAGGRINNGFGDVVLDYVVPTADLTSVSVRGTVVPGTTPTNWSVTAFAVCASVRGVQRVEFANPLSADDSKSITGSCPAGTALYGIGGSVSGGGGEIFLDMVHAIGTDKVATRASASGPVLPWALFAYGICAS
ncbi:hypothetical protein [Micromonospora sp. LOL_023]|uniref:hypothetical protein n=1 Tax=Micromonospora sp. LOL_023 TaxID=3345418 RepID=UPI003A88976E